MGFREVRVWQADDLYIGTRRLGRLEEGREDVNSKAQYTRVSHEADLEASAGGGASANTLRTVRCEVRQCQASSVRSNLGNNIFMEKGLNDCSIY